jgi:uncharacterized protein YceH (UPF0502 family)
MHPFDDLTEVEAVLDRNPELFVKLPRRAGEKEARYAHLLSGEPAIAEPEAAIAQPRHDRLSALEDEVKQLRTEIEELRTQFAGFKRQFE